jgi:hypothetical protein
MRLAYVVVRMRFKLLFPIALGVCAVAFAQGPFATTPPTTLTKISSYTPVGLGSTETMQVNIVNLASNPTPTASATPPAAVCTGTVSFLNAAGTVIGTPSPFSVANGQTFSVSLPFNSAKITGIRGEVRVTIQTTAPVHNAPACNLESSLETFDTVSGATHVYLSNPSGPQYAVGPIVLNGTGFTFTQNP